MALEARQLAGHGVPVGAQDFAHLLGSRREPSAVEPTRSTNMTVSCRRSAGGGDPASVAAHRRVPARTAMAASSLLRWPTEATPISRRSSEVSVVSSSQPMWLPRNASSYCFSPRPSSQAAMSTARSPSDASETGRARTAYLDIRRVRQRQGPTRRNAERSRRKAPAATKSGAQITSPARLSRSWGSWIRICPPRRLTMPLSRQVLSCRLKFSRDTPTKAPNSD